MKLVWAQGAPLRSYVNQRVPLRSGEIVSAPDAIEGTLEIRYQALGSLWVETSPPNTDSDISSDRVRYWRTFLVENIHPFDKLSCSTNHLVIP